MRHQTPLKDTLFPIHNPSRNEGNVWIDENHRQLRALFTCIELDNCGPNQAKGTSPLVVFVFFFFQSLASPPPSPRLNFCSSVVVILHSFHFKGGLWGWTGGEDIW